MTQREQLEKALREECQRHNENQSSVTVAEQWVMWLIVGFLVVGIIIPPLFLVAIIMVLWQVFKALVRKAQR